MDPLADKLTQMTVLMNLAYARYIYKWIVYVFVGKEIIMILSGITLFFLKEKIVIPSNIYGKTTTVLVYLAIMLSIFDWLIGDILLIIVLIFSIVALTQYSVIAIHKMKKMDKQT